MKTIFTQILDKLPDNSTRFLIAILIVVAVVVVTLGVPLSNNFTEIYIKQQEVAFQLELEQAKKVEKTVGVLETSLVSTYAKIAELDHTIERQTEELYNLQIQIAELRALCGKNTD